MKIFCLCGHELEEHFGEIAWQSERIVLDDEGSNGKALACWLGACYHPCQFMRCKCDEFVLDNLKYVKAIQDEKDGI